MDEDKFALVEKIILDVHSVMEKNAELSAFDIIPVDTNFQNKSPVLHLENCLGLESWCVKHVYMYCYSEIMDKYFAKPKRKALKLTSVNSDRFSKLLNITLLINPELRSLWNKRRVMVLKSFLNGASELRFTRLVLSRHPKCNEAFGHRKWLLESIIKDESLQNEQLQNMVNNELAICERAASSIPNNYHSWNHRIWIITMLRIPKEYDLSYQYIKEYEFSERWSAKNVSDHSCFHYRQFCINNVITVDNEKWRSFADVNTSLRKEFVQILASDIPNDSNIQASQTDLLSYSEDNLVKFLLCHSNKNCNCTIDNILVCRKLEVLFHELILNDEFLRFYKYHETLWYHRRFIVHEIMAILYDHFGVIRQNGVLVKKSCGKCNNDDLHQQQAKIVRYDSNRLFSSVLFNVLISHEKKFIEERRSDGDLYAERHQKYLQFIEG